MLEVSAFIFTGIDWGNRNMEKDHLPSFDDENDTGKIQFFYSDEKNHTATIDLSSLFSDNLTTSGSFDLRRINLAAFGKLLQALSVPTLLVSRSHAIRFANWAFSKLSRKPFQPKEAMFSSLFPNPVESRKALLLLEKVFRDHKPEVTERILQIHKTRIWARVHLCTIRLGADQMALVQIENLTAEKQLLTVQKYKRLVNIFPTAIGEFAIPKPVVSGVGIEQSLNAILDARVVDGNNKFAAVHHRRLIGDLAGARMGTLLPAAGRARTIYERWINSGFPLVSFETKEAIPPDGFKYFENNLIANVNRGRLLGFWWLKRDISEKKRIEEEILRHQKLESVGILAGGIAHDFNNLLTGILGNIALAQKNLRDDERGYERLESAAKACLRAQDLTRQLLTFSRGGDPIKKTASINELLQDSVMFALRGSKVRCNFEIPDSLWPTEIDEGQIYQVINNLVINSVQAMPDGGVISVRAFNMTVPAAGSTLSLKEGTYVAVSISDSGDGIPTENLKKIFDPYFTTKTTGTGLGLATCYSIIKKHGGIITVQSQPGVGSTFCFYLPASEAEVVVQTEPTVQSGPVRARILVMDDDETIRELVLELLGDMGYEVVLARDGAEAISAYLAARRENNGFDAVIMDLTIPGAMGGKEAIASLREIDPNVKAIVSSGYCNDPIMGDFRNYGFVGVLPKPYNPKELRGELQRVLEGDVE